MGGTLVIVSSPLQARHAAQYVAQSGVAPADCVVALVRSKTEATNAATRAVLCAAGLSVAEEFPPLLPAAPLPPDAPGREALWEAAELRVRADFAARAGAFMRALDGPVKRVVLGDYRPVSFRQFLTALDLREVECVLVDDGSVSRSVMAFRESMKHVAEVFRVRPFRPKHIDAADPLGYPDPSRLTFFSLYAGRLADGDRIVANRHYERVLDGVAVRALDEVWIAGCNHVEAGITDLDHYREVCARVRGMFPDAALVYLPHRGEGAAKVAEVADLLGAKVLETAGIEAHVEAEAAAPRTLVSFGSTVLDTLSRLLGDRTECLLVAPPDGYFIGARRDHVKSVVVSNVRDNAAVTGLFAVDPWAAQRRLNRRTVAAYAGAVPAGPEERAERFVLGAPDSVEGLVGQPAPDGATLYLETPTRGLHRLGWGSFDAVAGDVGFHTLRVAGEGRSAARLRLDCAGGQAQCDVDLDQDSVAFDSSGHLRFMASTHVDSRRRAVVNLMFSSAKPGAVSVQLVLRPDSAAKSSFMTGEPTIGISLLPPPSVDRRGVALGRDMGRAVVQIAARRGAANVLRLSAAGRSFDLVLHSCEIDDGPSASQGVEWEAGLAPLRFGRRPSGRLLRSSVPVLLTVADGRLAAETDRSRVLVALPDGADDVFVAFFDPFTGESRVLEVGLGASAPNGRDCYRVAY